MNVKSILYFFLLPSSLLATKGPFFSTGTFDKSGYTILLGSFVIFYDSINDAISKMNQYFDNPVKILVSSLIIAAICCLLTFLVKCTSTKSNFKLDKNSFEFPLTFIFYTVFWASCFALPFIFNRQGWNAFISEITLEHIKIYACSITSVTAAMVFVLFFVFFVPRLISHLAVILSIALIFSVLQNLSFSLLNLTLSFTFILLTVCFLFLLIPRINSISYMLKSTAFVLIKNLPSILPTLLVLSVLFQGQFIAIMMLVECIRFPFLEIIGSFWEVFSFYLPFPSWSTL